MNIIKGKTSPAPRIVIFGVHGVGKSSWACSAPKALALDFEGGLEQIGVDRVKAPDKWDASMALITEAVHGPGDYQTLVIDTVDRLEEQAAQLVCETVRKKSLGDFGYGEGFEAVATKWREMLFVLEGARAKGRTVILVAHVQQKTQDDPMLGKYDRLIAAMGKKAWGATARWSDALLFAAWESGLVDGRAIMTGQRLLYTEAATGFDAKNRWSLPKVLPLSWPVFADALKDSARVAEEVRQSIRALSKGSAELEPKAEQHIKEAGDDVRKLCAVERALTKKLSEQSSSVGTKP